jgi:hypothetical protein
MFQKENSEYKFILKQTIRIFILILCLGITIFFILKS